MLPLVLPSLLLLLLLLPAALLAAAAGWGARVRKGLAAERTGQDGVLLVGC